VQGSEDPRLLLPLGREVGGLDRRREHGGQQGEDLAQLRLEEVELGGADEQAAERPVADLEGHADHASDTAFDRPVERVLPAGVVVDHDELAGDQDLARHALARLEVDRWKDGGMVVGEHPDRAARLEPDQGGAPAAH